MTCGCSSHNGFLTGRGYAEAAQRRAISAEGLAAEPTQLYLDKVASVSGLAVAVELDFSLSDEDLENQYRRFLNGS